MKRLVTLLAALAFVLPLAAQQQPQQPFQEKLDVNVVLLDTVVTDAKGNQILGLGKDDFVVKENGIVQPIDSVDYFTNRQLLTGREEQAPFKVEQVKEDRYFVFFFDKPTENQLASDLMSARSAVRDFIDKDMKENDRVAIVGHDVRLKVYSDFTSDKAQLRRALESAAAFGPGLTTTRSGATASILSNVDSGEMKDHTGNVYEAIEVLADALKPIRARKDLVLFSPGIVAVDEDVRDGIITNRSQHLDPMLHALNGANVAVYPVQLQRDADQTSFLHQRLEEMADSTGGRYFQFNTSFTPAIQQIERTNSGYYLITYRAHHPHGASGFQKVDVSVKNPEMRVTSRSGYEFGR